MPMQKASGGFASRLRAKLNQSLAKHKNDETDYGNFGDLPPGIEGGIAQLVEAKLGQYKEGDLKDKDFLYMAGVVVQPTTFEGQKIEGKRTALTIPLCDTPMSKKSFDENFAKALNELRKLGVDTSTLSGDSFEPTLEAIKEMGPYFTFRTWRGKATKEFPNPKVQHNWGGLTEYTADLPNDPGATVTERPAKNGTSTNGSKPAMKKPPMKKPEPEPEPETTFDEFGDIDSLLAAAGNDDEGGEAARAKLMEMAIEVGMTEEEVSSAASWDEVVERINAGKSEEGSSESEEFVPKKGDVHHYYPFDPIKKKKAAKPVECEVTAVDLKGKTVNLKNLDNGKVFNKVPFSEISPE